MTRAALYLRPNEPLAIERVDLADPGPFDVVIAVEASGICHSDLSVAQGKYGALFPHCTILGHEGTGTVVDVGAGVTRIKKGDRVVGTPNPVCGACSFCVSGETHLCDLLGPPIMVPRGTRRGEPVVTMAGIGSFAETMVCAEASVVAVRSSLPSEQLALIGCAVATGVGAALNTAEVRVGDTVAVVGCGGVGQSVLQGARIAGASKLIAIDPIPMKRELARAQGATDTIDPHGEDPVAQTLELTRGRGVDHVFEVVGTAATIVQATQMARKGGCVTVVSSLPVGHDLTLPAFLDFRSQGKQLRSSVFGSTRSRCDFQRYIDLAEVGRLDLASMVSQTIALDDIDAAMRALDAGEVVRTIINRF